MNRTPLARLHFTSYGRLLLDIGHPLFERVAEPAPPWSVIVRALAFAFVRRSVHGYVTELEETPSQVTRAEVPCQMMPILRDVTSPV